MHDETPPALPGATSPSTAIDGGTTADAPPINLNTVYPDFNQVDNSNYDPPSPASATTPTPAGGGPTDIYGFTRQDILKFTFDKDAFLAALQDKGEQNEKDNLLFHYPKLTAFTKKIYKHWSSKKFPDLPKNIT